MVQIFTTFFCINFGYRKSCLDGRSFICEDMRFSNDLADILTYKSEYYVYSSQIAQVMRKR